MSVMVLGDDNGTISACAVAAPGEEPYLYLVLSRRENSKAIRLRPDRAMELGQALIGEASALLVFSELQKEEG